MELGTSSKNMIFDNMLLNNDYGIVTRIFYNNEFYHNSFIGNTLQVYDWSQYSPIWGSSENVWDDGHLVGGNYWDLAIGNDVFSGIKQNEIFVLIVKN